MHTIVSRHKSTSLITKTLTLAIGNGCVTAGGLVLLLLPLKKKMQSLIIILEEHAIHLYHDENLTVMLSLQR